MRSNQLFIVKDDAVHHMGLFDMGFMVFWRYRNSSYSPVYVQYLLELASDD